MEKNVEVAEPEASCSWSLGLEAGAVLQSCPGLQSLIYMHRRGLFMHRYGYSVCGKGQSLLPQFLVPFPSLAIYCIAHDLFGGLVLHHVPS